MHDEPVVEVEDRGSGKGEIEAGLQMDTGAELLVVVVMVVVLDGGVNWPLSLVAPSRTGEPFFFRGLFVA